METLELSYFLPDAAIRRMNVRFRKRERKVRKKNTKEIIQTGIFPQDT